VAVRFYSVVSWVVFVSVYSVIFVGSRVAVSFYSVVFVGCLWVAEIFYSVGCPFILLFSWVVSWVTVSFYG